MRFGPENGRTRSVLDGKRFDVVATHGKTRVGHKTPSEKQPKPEPIDWEGGERSAEIRQQFEGKDGTKPFKYFGRYMDRFFPALDERPAYTGPNLSHKQ